jgi:hypothetical protein
MIRGKLLGADAMRKKLKDIAAKFPDRVAAAIFSEAQIEMTEAKRRCPVSPTPAPKGVVPGTMRASGTVHEPERSGRSISVPMSFGGAAADYVVPQHENPDYFHTTGEYKWLEKTLNESRPHMAGRIARRVDLNKMRDV